MIISRDDSDLFKIWSLKKYLIGINGIIAGGVFKNIFNNEKIKDVDIFFRSKDDFNIAKKKYDDDNRFELSYKNSNVYAYIEKSTGIIIELIKKKFYNTESILDEFDFSIVKFCYFFETDYDEDSRSVIYNYEVKHHNDFFEHLIQKKLVIDDQKLLYPFSTFERSYKYTLYGYRLCKFSKIRLINAIREEKKFDDTELTKSLYGGLD